MTTRPKPAHERPLHQPLQTFDLEQTASQVMLEPAYAAGRTAITLRKAPGCQIVLLALQAGYRLDEHRAAGPLTLQVLSGRARFATPGEAVELVPQMLLALDGGILRSVEALEASVCLLTLGSHESTATTEVERS